MNTLLHDFRYALRQLRNSPGFAITAALTLALGIGANTAVFSFVDAALLKSLPYPEPDRLVRVYDLNAKQTVDSNYFSPQDFEDLHGQASTFAGLAAFQFVPGLTEINLTGVGEPLRLQAADVSGGFFPTLEAAAKLGRTFTEADDQPGHNAVAVISASLWRDRFAQDRNIIGRKVDLGNASYTVIGVMPAEFQYPSKQVQVWVPLSTVPDSAVPHRRGIRWLSVIGRLRPGVSASQAQQNITSLIKNLEKQYPGSNAGWERAKVEPLRESLVAGIRPALFSSWASSGLVLLIACANIAALLLTRAVKRSREMGIRLAVGASRRDLIRQQLAEGALLGLLGGAAGLTIAVLSLRGLATLGAHAFPQLSGIQVDVRAIVMTFSLAMLSSVLFSLIPAFASSRSNAAESLHNLGRGVSESLRSRHMREVFVVAEAALAVMLLVACGLLVKSFWRLSQVDPGFAVDHVLSLRVAMPGAILESDQKTAAYRNQLLSEIAAVPGVLSVGSSKTLPLEGGGEPYGFSVMNVHGLEPVSTPSGMFLVTSGYFATLKVPLLQGDVFSSQDDWKGRPVVVVNGALAIRVWPGESAVGKKLYLGKHVFEVIGVVGNVRNDGLAEAAGPAIYGPTSLFPRSKLEIVVRTAGDPTSSAGAIRAAIHRVDPNQPVMDIATLNEVVSGEMARPRFVAALLSCFGAIALLLSAIGLYGMMSYSVQQQRREIGVRMALGAQPGQVLRRVFGRGVAIALCGMVLGIGCAFLLGRILSSVLYGIGPRDVTVFLAAPIVLLVFSAIASWLPARRAANVDPMQALRME